MMITLAGRAVVAMAWPKSPMPYANFLMFEIFARPGDRDWGDGFVAG